MKKLCLLCNQLDESGSYTCLHCGEATWSVQESAPEAPVVEVEAPAKPKRGKK